VAGSSLVWCDSDAKGLQAELYMSEHINAGCARLDVGMKYEANPACCLDLLTAAMDDEYCGMTEEEAQSMNIGHPFDLGKAKSRNESTRPAPACCFTDDAEPARRTRPPEHAAPDVETRRFLGVCSDACLPAQVL
jgi:hypothetical protein